LKARVPEVAWKSFPAAAVPSCTAYLTEAGPSSGALRTTDTTTWPSDWLAPYCHEPKWISPGVV
jgi:hypothetical protein